jgi:iron complex outermembrane receptor protein
LAATRTDGLVGTYSGDHVDYRVAAQYEWTDTIMTYVQTATGFKGGGVNPRPYIDTQVQPFGQEKLTSYEAGVKTQLLDYRLRLNLAGFYSDYTNIQLISTSCPEFSPAPNFPCTMPINGGSADVWGIEAEGNFEPVDNLLLDGSASWMDFSYRTISPTAAGVDLSDVTPFTPTWKWSLGAQYTAYVNDDLSLTPRVDLSYQSKAYSTAENFAESMMRGYTLANARVTLRDEANGWEAALQVTNVFDKYYVTSIYYSSPARANLAYGAPGHPREWALTVKKSF